MSTVLFDNAESVNVLTGPTLSPVSRPTVLMLSKVTCVAPAGMLPRTKRIVWSSLMLALRPYCGVGVGSGTGSGTGVGFGLGFVIGAPALRSTPGLVRFTSHVRLMPGPLL